MYANVRKARIRCGDSTSLPMSGFSSMIAWTIEPIGSSTSGIQSSSSRSSVISGLLLLSPGPPRDLRCGEEQKDGEELSKHVLGQAFGDLGAADRGAGAG